VANIGAGASKSIPREIRNLSFSPRLLADMGRMKRYQQDSLTNIDEQSRLPNSTAAASA
jgi:hypothetical protein